MYRWRWQGKFQPWYICTEYTIIHVHVWVEGAKEVPTLNYDVQCTLLCMYMFRWRGQRRFQPCYLCTVYTIIHVHVWVEGVKEVPTLNYDVHCTLLCMYMFRWKEQRRFQPCSLCTVYTIIHVRVWAEDLQYTVKNVLVQVNEDRRFKPCYICSVYTIIHVRVQVERVEKVPTLLYMYSTHYYICTMYMYRWRDRGGFNSVIYVPCTLLFMYTSICSRYKSDYQCLNLDTFLSYQCHNQDTILILFIKTVMCYQIYNVIK